MLLRTAYTAAFLSGALFAAGHWSFERIGKPEPPAVSNSAWTRNPIDAFVLARLEKEEIRPSPEADKATLLRRLSLDLTGLPPAARELTDFLADSSPGAYERAVERLLASPHFGEKWGRHWLDLARYADSDGYESDLPRPHAWRYRQWVIDALNRDMPFDQFTIEQMAGDLLPGATVEQRVATGFHRNTLTNREGGVDTEQFRVEQVFDRTNTLGSVWLGLSVGCAQCHDHKFDPISQKEYYQLFAFFNTAREEDIDAPLPGELGPLLKLDPEYETKRRAFLEEYGLDSLQRDWEQKMLHAAKNPGESDEWDTAWKFFGNNTVGGQPVLRLDPAKRTNSQRRMIEDFFVRTGLGKMGLEKARLEEIRKKFRALQAEAPAISRAQVVAEAFEPPKSHILLGGDFLAKGIEVEAAVPQVLPDLPEGKRDRLALARWLVSRDNPLTARVTVNRIWQELFGRGLVGSSDDFGTQGEKPSHPELLDWLAAEFMDNGWSAKSMIRLIVTSSTYRQTSNARPDIQDPGNLLLARQGRLRLPAELVRDSALAAGGLLNTAVGGRSIRPPQPKGVAELGYADGIKWEETKGIERYRRGLYIHFQRTVPYPQLAIFDAPGANLSCSRRERSNTPLQALNLLNDPVFFEAAQGLALRVLREAPPGFRDRLNHAYRLCYGRPASPREADRLAGYFEQQRAAMPSGDALKLLPVPPEGIEPEAAAAWTLVARVLLNSDEFIHRE
jgi:hypothetical protein